MAIWTPKPSGGKAKPTYAPGEGRRHSRETGVEREREHAANERAHPAQESPLTADEERSRLPELRRLVRLMDEAVGVPGTRIRLGLDALLGLVPGVGDVVGAVVSGRVLLASARLGVPAPVLARMAGNMAIDALVGEIPLLGDLFDIGWKANRRNLDLLERHLADPEGTRRGSRRLVVTAVVLAVLTPLLALTGMVWLIVTLARALPL